jgi:hypothetical protein
VKLVDNWKSLWRSWSVQIAALGVYLPELLGFIADNVAYLPAVDDTLKSLIRVACLIGVLLVRPIKQKSLE